ncbi:MAG: hypothetical protein R8G66_23990 [Cytophagales bacterium]|nr:hypothetical protein [Cytophagales bacterium]
MKILRAILDFFLLFVATMLIVGMFLRFGTEAFQRLWLQVKTRLNANGRLHLSSEVLE